LEGTFPAFLATFHSSVAVASSFAAASSGFS